MRITQKPLIKILYDMQEREEERERKERSQIKILI